MKDKYINANCTSWSFESPYLISGQSLIDESFTQSALYYDAHLVRDGWLSIRYKKNTKMVNEFKSGFFAVEVNGDVVHDNEDLSKDDW
jgi:hypothetical protein